MNIQSKDENITLWLCLRDVYRALGSEYGNKIIRVLLSKKNMADSIKSTELMELSRVPSSKFYPAIKALVQTQVVDKKVHADRSVSYSLSEFGENILRLSDPLLEEVKKKLKDEDSSCS